MTKKLSNHLAPKMKYLNIHLKFYPKQKTYNGDLEYNQTITE